MDRLTSMMVFVAATEDGSLVAAARRFGLSASMAGKHIAAIEAELSVRLMQRNTRSLALTEAGRAYYARAKRILEEYDDIRREVTDAQAAVRGVLRIAAPSAFAEMQLRGVIADYMAEYPGVSIELVLGDRYVDLLAEGFDLAIRIGRLPDSGLIARRLAPCRMVFCASPAFLAAHGAPQNIEELRRAPRLTFSDAVSGGDWTIFDQFGQPHLIDGEVRMRANSMTMLLAGALGGAGVAYGPSFVFGQSLAAGALVRLLPHFRSVDLGIYAMHASRRYVTAKLRSFVDHIAAHFGIEPPWDRS